MLFQTSIRWQIEKETVLQTNFVKQTDFCDTIVSGLFSNLGLTKVHCRPKLHFLRYSTRFQIQYFIILFVRFSEDSQADYGEDFTLADIILKKINDWDLV